MKKLLLSILLTTIGVYLFSQSFILSYDGNTIPNGGSIMIMCDPGDEVVTGYIACTNDNAEALSVKTKKIIYEGDTLTGTSNYFCWGACFPPFIYVSPTSITIDPTNLNPETMGQFQNVQGELSSALSRLMVVIKLITGRKRFRQH